MSTWTNWAETLETADLSGSNITVYQKFRSIDGNKILRAIRSYFIFQNLPTFTNLKFRLYSVTFDGRVGALISESNGGGILLADVPSLNPVVMKDKWWEFDYIKLRENVWYAIAPYDPTYVRTGTKHIAWRKDYPDPVYRTNNNPGLVTAAKQSHSLSFVTADL